MALIMADFNLVFLLIVGKELFILHSLFDHDATRVTNDDCEVRWVSCNSVGALYYRD
jgi:hypothetical protein